MHTPSTRILSALAYDRGEEYDPAEPVCRELVEALTLVEHAAPVIGEDGPYERARQRRRERRERDGDPDVVLGQGPDRRAVGARRRAVRLTDRYRSAARALPRVRGARASLGTGTLSRAST